MILIFVADCAQRLRYRGLVDRGRVIDLDRRSLLALGLPEWPVPVVVPFGGPWPEAPAVRWR